MMTISILIPVYGVEKYIEQCARSLFEQSYAQIEYIFVNDCTKDNSIHILENVIKQYPERASQVHIIQHPHNKGVGAARQTALMTSTGEYITFVDSDDFIPADAIESLVNAAEENHADLIEGGYAEWDGKDGAPQMPVAMSKEKYLKLLLCQNIIPNRLWGRIYKRSLIMEHKIFFQEGIDYAEDLFWNAQFLYYGNRTHINKVVYKYRTDNSCSYTHNISEKNLMSYFKSSRMMIQFFETISSGSNMYRKAIEIGIVNAYRWCASAHVALQKIDDNLAYKPQSLIIRFIISLIKTGYPVKWVNILYLSYRRLYTMSLK